MSWVHAPSQSGRLLTLLPDLKRLNQLKFELCLGWGGDIRFARKGSARRARAGTRSGADGRALAPSRDGSDDCSRCRTASGPDAGSLTTALASLDDGGHLNLIRLAVHGDGIEGHPKFGVS